MNAEYRGKGESLWELYRIRYSWVSLPIEFPIPQISRVTVSMLTDELRETTFRKDERGRFLIIPFL